MENKHVLFCILAIIAVVALVGIVLMMAMEYTGAYVFRHQGRARPGDWNYQGGQPYSGTPRNMPAQQDVFMMPENPNQQ